MELIDAQWKLIEPLIPENERLIRGRRGRPWRPAREVLNGILWILRTGARWKDLPSRYPPYQTCHRRFQRWVRAGGMERILQALARDLKERGKLSLREGFIDGTFVIARKGGQGWERRSGAKAPNSWQLRTGQVFLSPYALQVLRRMK